MNSFEPRHPWTRLTASARQVSDERPTSAPFGFATRVAALALAQEQRIYSLFERFALRAVAVSSLLALVSMAVNYSEIRSGFGTNLVPGVEESSAVHDDALAAVIEIGD